VKKTYPIITLKVNKDHLAFILFIFSLEELQHNIDITLPLLSQLKSPINSIEPSNPSKMSSLLSTLQSYLPPHEGLLPKWLLLVR
jgi:hypothetical protein